MALQPQRASFQFRGGLDTKSDPKAVPAAKLLACRNAIFKSPGRLKKRPGNAALSRAIAGSSAELGDAVADGGGGPTQALMPYRDELLAADLSRLYSYDSGSAQWIDKGRLASLRVTKDAVCVDVFTAYTQDGAVHSGGLQLFVWSRALDTTSLMYAVLDTATGQLVVTPTQFTSAGTQGRVLVHGNNFFIYYYDTTTTTLKVATLPVGNPAAALSFAEITTSTADANGLDTVAPNYDAAVFDSASVGPQVYLAFRNRATGGGISLWRSPVSAPATVAAKVTIASEVPKAITVFGNAYDDTVVVGYFNNTGGNGSAVLFRTYTARLVSTALGFTTPITIDATNDTFVFTGGLGTAAGTLTATIASGTYTTTAAFIAAFQAALNASTIGGVPYTSCGGTITMTISSLGYVTLTAGPLVGDTHYAFQTNAASQAFGTLTGFGTAEVYAGGDVASQATTGASTMPAVVTAVSGDPTLTAFGIAEALTDVVSITGIAASTTSLDIRFYYTVSAASDANYHVRTASVTGTYRVSTWPFMMGLPWCDVTASAAEFLRSVALAGKAFRYGGLVYVPLVHDSAEQGTYFVADGNARIVARFLAGAAGEIPATPAAGVAQMLPSVTAFDDSTFRIPLLQKTQGGILSAAAGTMTIGVVSIALDFFEPAESYLRAQLADTLHINGGFLAMYDGRAVVEHGFHLYPEGLASTPPGGAIVYQYTACYAWSDNKGQVHRSGIAPPISVARGVAISGGSTQVVTIPSLRLTARENLSLDNLDGRPARIELYRTEGNGELFYLCGVVGSLTTSDTRSITDDVTDATLVGQLPLYTRGDVFPNVAPPPFSAMTVHRNRIFGVDSLNRNTVWASKEVSPSTDGLAGAPVEFAAELAFGVDPVGGDTTAIASLDSALVLFKRAAILAKSGRGPDATGAQNDWSDTQLVTTACGCTNPRSVVTTPAGLVFQSLKGFWLLSRDLQATYIGADVEAYNGDTVTSGVLLENANQVRFTLSSGVELVYDYEAGQWATFTGINAVDSAIWNGERTWLRDDGTAFVETPESFTDGGSHVPLDIETAWLQFSGQQGLQRIWEFLILGEYYGPHKLIVDIAYDFDPNPKQTEIITPSAPGTYGSDSPYGSGTPYGGEFPLYQYRVFLKQQQSQAVKIRIRDVPVGAPGESCSLSALTFLVGVTPRLRQVQASRST